MQTITNHARLLNETNIFAGVSEATLDKINSIARERTAYKDQFIYQEGDDAIDIYILLSGSVRFTLGEKVTGVLSSGTVLKSRSVFGWVALVPEHPRRLGAAKCMETSSLLAIEGDKVLEALRSDPASGFIVMERLCAMIARNFMEQRGQAPARA